MKKRIITIGRQFGSGGHSVGLLVSKKLSLPFYDQALVEQIAAESGMDTELVEERVEEAPIRSGFVYNFVGRGLNGLSVPDLLWAAECRVIKKIANEGPCVIVGRCADYLLKDRDDVLKVFVYADQEFKEARIIERYGETTVTAGKALREKDGKRAAHYRYYTGQKWGRPENYHVLLNTAEFGIEEVADYIIEMYEKS